MADETVRSADADIIPDGDGNFPVTSEADAESGGVGLCLTAAPVSEETTDDGPAVALTSEIPLLKSYETDAEEENITVSEKRTRRSLIFLLICTVLATVAVIVYGTYIVDGISRLSFPVGEKLLSEVFGAVSSVKGNYTPPTLQRIHGRPAVEGEENGAAEEETYESSYDGAPAIPDGEDLPVRNVDLSVSADDVFAIINETPYEPDVLSLYAAESKIPPLSELYETYGEGAPVVLIIHTHGTESFLPSGATTYDSSETFRSLNGDESVITVGRVAAARLRERGIGVIHIETMFDSEDYNSAYRTAAAEIQRIKEEYPSISYVFDIHRDAMITAEGTNLRPTSPITWNGGAASQIMLVVGTDYAGSGHTEWQDNLSLALKIQKKALGLNGGIMRAINLRSASFNQQYVKGSILVEMGACGGSLTEACRSAEIFAEAAAEVIYGE